MFHTFLTPVDRSRAFGIFFGTAEGLPRLSGPGGDFVELPRLKVMP